MPTLALSERLAPGPLAPTDARRFSSPTGPSLYGEWFEIANPRGAALIVHGYAEHCGRYRELAHVLTQAGLVALSYDMRGHGRADGQRGHIQTIGEYLDDMDAALAELDARVHIACAGRTLPRLLIGHSNGALIVLRALTDPSRKPRDVRAAVVTSPFLRLRADVSLPKQILGRAAGSFAPRLSLPNHIRVEDLTSDPAKQAERRVDTLCHDVASAGWFTASVQAQDYVADFASRIDVPTLWLVSHDDKLADPATSRVVRARLRAPSAYHGFETMQHEVFMERERDVAFGLLRDFVEEMMSAQ